MLAFYSAIASFINHFDGGVSAFVIPKTTKRISLSLPSVSSMHDGDLREEENTITVEPKSRRAILGRAAGGLTASMLTLLSVPSSGIAAVAPSKVRAFDPPKCYAIKTILRYYFFRKVMESRVS